MHKLGICLLIAGALACSCGERESGSSSCDGTGFEAGTAADTVRILGVGNSWTRDCMRYLSAIAGSAGVPVIAGHGYLGGSTLEDQYRGLLDTAYAYTHMDWEQKVRHTYQYWKYICSDTAVKTPSPGDYRNGRSGIGVTLGDVVSDEPWDVVVFQPEATLGGELPRMLGREDASWNLSFLVDSVLRMCGSSPEIALMVPFAYPKGNTDYREKFVRLYHGGKWPRNQRQWDRLYRKQYRLIRRAASPLARHIGAGALIPVAQAVHAARQDTSLSRYGYLLQRAQDNTHLAEGLPKYLASLCYAYILLDLRPEEITWCPPDCSPEDALRARKLAWEVCQAAGVRLKNRSTPRAMAPSPVTLQAGPYPSRAR